jgi:hypothetical protein
MTDQREKWRAYRAVQYAIQTGELEPSDSCMECGWSPLGQNGGVMESS